MKSEMKNDNPVCQACELAIMSGEVAQNPELAKHLQECPDCREFADFQQNVLSIQLPELPPGPELSVIRQKMLQHQHSRQRLRHVIIYPLATAAAAAVVIAGIMFWHPEPARPLPEDLYKLTADPELWSAAVDESSVFMAWDQEASSEIICRESVRAALQNTPWSIEFEMANFYNEE